MTCRPWAAARDYFIYLPRRNMMTRDQDVRAIYDDIDAG